MRGRSGFCPDPAWGAYSPDPVARLRALLLKGRECGGKEEMGTRMERRGGEVIPPLFGRKLRPCVSSQSILLKTDFTEALALCVCSQAYVYGASKWQLSATLNVPRTRKISCDYSNHCWTAESPWQMACDYRLARPVVSHNCKTICQFVWCPASALWWSLSQNYCHEAGTARVQQ